MLLEMALRHVLRVDGAERIALLLVKHPQSISLGQDLQWTCPILTSGGSYWVCLKIVIVCDWKTMVYHHFPPKKKPPWKRVDFASRGFKDMTPELAYDHVMSRRRVVPGMLQFLRFGMGW